MQNELLKVIEKGIVCFEYGGRASGQTITLQTDHMLFIVLGHFEKLWKNNKTLHQKFPKITNEDLYRMQNEARIFTPFFYKSDL
ncbi:hypothetical protein [Helicobacter salomonis]|uniref:hypothetical protein n=1 Tax=Helicobacter salomonis TaxID=56878 RepID=UPI001F32F148|nr:hypothetical protein [Helicobacter salomonis]